MQLGFKGNVFSLELLKRILFYGIATLLLGSLQCAFFPLLDFCPATPDLIITMLTAIALLDSPKSAAICALASGFFIDAIGSSGIALSPVIYLLGVMIVSFFTDKILKGFPSFLLLLIPTLLWRAFSTYAYAAISEKALPAASIFADIILPELLCTALLAIPVYFIVKLCTVPLQSHGRFNFQ